MDKHKTKRNTIATKADREKHRGGTHNTMPLVEEAELVGGKVCLETYKELVADARKAFEDGHYTCSSVAIEHYGDGYERLVGVRWRTKGGDGRMPGLSTEQAFEWQQARFAEIESGEYHACGALRVHDRTDGSQTISLLRRKF